MHLPGPPPGANELHARTPTHDYPLANATEIHWTNFQ